LSAGVGETEPGGTVGETNSGCEVAVPSPEGVEASVGRAVGPAKLEGVAGDEGAAGSVSGARAGVSLGKAGMVMLGKRL
jgi:hypothetical protein